MLQAAARIAHGQVPYSDFWWFYPPGQPYLLGGLWALFGPSLLTWRIVRVLCDAAVAMLAYLLARRAAPPWLATLAWLGAACAMAFPSGPHPFPIALGCALGALLLFERRPLARRRPDRRERGLAARVRRLRGAGDPARLRGAPRSARGAPAARRPLRAARARGGARALPARGDRGRPRALVAPDRQLPAHDLRQVPVAAVPAPTTPGR